MYIPDEKIEEIRLSTDIIDVVSDYVRLKRRGSNYFGLCPFHNEKSPSFSVNPGMGIFKCFGCGEGGNAFQFVMRMETLSFPEAARMLAERAGILIPEQIEQQEQASEVESIYHALRFAARYYYQQLTQTEAGQQALAYLTERGFSPKMIKTFGLGYAPDAWEALLREAEAAHVEAEMLEKAGLVLPRRDEGGYYDRFRGRVLFPIFSHVGKVLGFGGRILTASSDQPKYINSPETRVYNKSRVLYGLYQAKHAIRRQEEVLLVEGYTDVMALHQAGVEHVVASSGTALTTEQVKMLGRYAKRIVLLYDADVAGSSAALRGIDLVLEGGLTAYAVALPPGEDPDSFAREHGGEAFRVYVKKHQQDFVSFMYVLARRRGELDTPEGEADVMRSVMASIARIPDTLRQETFVRRASDVLNVPDLQLRGVLKDLLRARTQQVRREHRREQLREERPPEITEVPVQAAPTVPAEPVAPPARLQEPLPQEKILLRLMLEQGTSMVEFILSHMAMDEFTEGPAREIVSALLRMYEEGTVNTQLFFEGGYSGPVQSLAAEVMVVRHEPSDNWQRKNIPVPRLNARPEEAATSAMTLLKRARVSQAIERHNEKIYRAQQQGEDLRALQEEMMRLHELNGQIERREFLRWHVE